MARAATICFVIIALATAAVLLGQLAQSQSADDFKFIGEKAGACPVGYSEFFSSEHIGKNFIRTCAQNNDGNAANDDRVIAIGSLAGACPVGYTQKYSSEHIGLNYVLTCSKVDPAPAIALGEKETTCPAGYTSNGTFEHIGLNNITTCKKIALLSVSLSANPSTGPAPLNNVDLTASVSNAGAGDITYQFDCADDGIFELTIATPTNPYTATDLCDYVTTGTYTAKVIATQGGESPFGTAAITVTKAPKIKEILP